MARLTRERWIEEGIVVLRQDGPAALAADRMARRLNVTRGSFYWHFDNALDFQACVLGEWEQRWTGRMVATIAAAGASPKARLHALIANTGSNDASVYASAKRMAADHPELDALLAEVDQGRVELVAALLADGGVPADLVLARAQVIYAWAVGQMLIEGDRSKVPPPVAEALVFFAFDGA
ncbi:MAG TPA: TetR/AcrR family transcriptional regulator [Allosphingosinicella sp.]|jgi:AcrR family transcriptional regulator